MRSGQTALAIRRRSCDPRDFTLTRRRPGRDLPADQRRCRRAWRRHPDRTGRCGASVAPARPRPGPVVGVVRARAGAASVSSGSAVAAAAPATFERQPRRAPRPSTLADARCRRSGRPDRRVQAEQPLQPAPRRAAGRTHSTARRDRRPARSAGWSTSVTHVRRAGAGAMVSPAGAVLRARSRNRPRLPCAGPPGGAGPARANPAVTARPATWPRRAG